MATDGDYVLPTHEEALGTNGEARGILASARHENGFLRCLRWPKRSDFGTGYQIFGTG